MYNRACKKLNKKETEKHKKEVVLFILALSGPFIYYYFFKWLFLYIFNNFNGILGEKKNKVFNLTRNNTI